MDDDRVGLGVRVAVGFLERAALTALFGVGGGILIGDFALREALQAHSQARGVHHDEHGLEPLLGLADEPALRSVEIHHASGVSVDTHLLFERAARERVALAQ